MRYRNLIFGGCITLSMLLAGAGILRALEAPPPQKRLETVPALHLRLALLLEREQADGTLRALGRDATLQVGDRVQVTIQPEQSGYLMVGTISQAGELSLLYPAPEQTGEVRGEWAYALPAPHQRYTFDGEPMRLVVLLRRQPFSEKVEERRGTLLHALRKGTSERSAHGPVVLTLEDGRPAKVGVDRYSGHAKVLAVVALESPQKS